MLNQLRSCLYLLLIEGVIETMRCMYITNIYCFCIHTEGKFALDEFSGRLYSNIEFDREAQDVYDITIQAFRVEFLTKRSVQSSKLTFHERYLLNNMVGYHHYV